MLAADAVTGAATPNGTEAAGRHRFVRARDTVGFTNETRWIYEFDAQGRMHTRRREPPPTYSLRCFVVARLNRQFFDHARFEPEATPVPEAELRRRIRRIVARTSRRPSPAETRVVIPGFRDLRQFSETHAALLQELGGPARDSYLQRGHWRMLFPFSRRHQGRVAEGLASALADGRPRLVHLVRFPQLTINHAVLVFAAQATPEGWDFQAADPNSPDRPSTLSYRRADQTFTWPPNTYFGGGRVDVYEVYRNSWY